MLVREIYQPIGHHNAGIVESTIVRPGSWLYRARADRPVVPGHKLGDGSQQRLQKYSFEIRGLALNSRGVKLVYLPGYVFPLATIR